MNIGRRVVQCPYCEQGYVVKAVVKRTGQEISICEECDTCWVAKEKCRVLGFPELMAEQGGEPLWSELEVFAVQTDPVPYVE